MYDGSERHRDIERERERERESNAATCFELIEIEMDALNVRLVDHACPRHE